MPATLKQRPTRKPIVSRQRAAAGQSVLEQIENHPTSTMSVARYAQIIGVTPKAVYDGINRGDIPTLIVPGIRKRILDPRTLSIWMRTHNPVLNVQ